MFKNIFSFSGRIRRTEFWLIGPLIWVIMIPVTMACFAMPLLLLIVWIIPFWISTAALVKRSHDMGNSGWLIIIPIYNPLILAFGGSQPFTNEYGQNPKGININNNQQQPTVIIHNNSVGSAVSDPSFVSKEQKETINMSEIQPENQEPELIDKIKNTGKDLMTSINKNLGNKKTDETADNNEDDHHKKIEQLKQLKQLFDEGILTKEEFDQQKSLIL